MMGVRRTTDFIEKATWTLAATIGILTIVSVFVMPRNITVSSRVQTEEAPMQVTGTEYASPAAENATPAMEVLGDSAK